MRSYWSITLATLAKDIRLEWRSKDALNAMLFFSLLVVVIFVFSFDPLAEESRHIAGGLIWVAFLFATVVALNQTWARELRTRCSMPTRLTRPRHGVVSGQGARQLHSGQPAGGADGALFVIFYNLRVLGPAWQLIPCAAGNLGAGGDGTFSPPCQCARAAASLCCRCCCFPFLFPPCWGWWLRLRTFLPGEFRALLHRIASHLRCGVYYSVYWLV